MNKTLKLKTIDIALKVVFSLVIVGLLLSIGYIIHNRNRFYNQQAPEQHQNAPKGF